MSPPLPRDAVLISVAAAVRRGGGRPHRRPHRHFPGWAMGPIIGGSVMQLATLAAPLFIGGTLKIVYDLARYRALRNIRPREEQICAAPAR